jgi:hypothetical protein
MTKICKECGKEKETTEFYVAKSNKDGLTSKCKICRAISDKEYRENNKEKLSERAKIYYKENTESILIRVKEYNKDRVEEKAEYDKKYREENEEKLKERSKVYYKENKIYLIEYQKEYREENREKLAEYHSYYWQENQKELTEYSKEYQKSKRKTDPIYKLMKNVSRSIAFILKTAGSSKNEVSSKIKVPFNGEELMKHLESQFNLPENLTPDGRVWMTRNNQGAYNKKYFDEKNPLTWTWHIDHIIPQSKLKFDSYDHPNFLKCWSLENLRPLRADLNIKKSNKIL